jgi:hypothetical protein
LNNAKDVLVTDRQTLLVLTEQLCTLILSISSQVLYTFDSVVP